jgi:hypothetical protein
MSNWWRQIQERLKHEERKLYGADNLFIKSMQGEVRQTPFAVEPLVAQILADLERSRTGLLRCPFTGQIDEMGTWEPPRITRETISPQHYDRLVAEGLLKPTDDNPNTAHPVEENGIVIKTIVVYKWECIPE